MDKRICKANDLPKRQRIKVSLICFALAGAIFAAWIVHAMTARGGDTTFLIASKKALGNTLPQCYGPSCAAKLHVLRIQIRKPEYVYGDAELFFEGKLYHAHVRRIEISDYWIWQFQGHVAWYRAMKWLSAQHPDDIVGPVSLKQLESKPAICQAIAEKLLINVTSDAGTLRQPNPINRWVCSSPTDAGIDACHVEIEQPSWPDGGVIQCGVNYFLARSRLGGTWGTPPYEPEAGWPAMQSSDAKAPSVPRIQHNAWQTPDARVSKTCPNVPVGTQCP